MTDTGLQRLTTDEAHAAVESVAFTIAEEFEGAGRRIVHVFMGPFGADWDVEGVHTLIDKADDIAWMDDLVGHDLAVLADGKVHRLDVRKPS